MKKIEIKDINDLNIKASAHNLCYKHGEGDSTITFCIELDINQDEIKNKDRFKEMIQLLQLDDCCDEGYRYKITIEQYEDHKKKGVVKDE